MKMSDIRELGADELLRKEGDLREELFNLKFQHAVGKLESSARLRVVRRDIARVLTVKRESISKEG